MQRDADFITAGFLYTFRASSAHHQEYKILTRQPPVQVDLHSFILGTKLCFVPNMTEWRSTCIHNYLYQWLPCQYFILLMMGAWRPKRVEKVCSNKICVLLHHVDVLFNLIIHCRPSFICLIGLFGFIARLLWYRQWIEPCPMGFPVILVEPAVFTEVEGSKFLYNISKFFTVLCGIPQDSVI